MDCVKDFGGVNIDEANEFIYDLERLRVEGVGGGIQADVILCLVHKIRDIFCNDGSLREPILILVNFS